MKMEAQDRLLCWLKVALRDVYATTAHRRTSAVWRRSWTARAESMYPDISQQPTPYLVRKKATKSLQHTTGNSRQLVDGATKQMLRC